MIFELRDNEPYITPLGLNIPAFKAIWDSDRKKDKAQAQKELAYCFHMAHIKSPYNQFQEDDRHKQIVADYNLKGFRPGRNVKRAIKQIKELPPNNTPMVRMLEGAREVADKLAIYFKSVDFTLMDDNGNLVYDAKKVVDTLKSVGQVVKSLVDLEEQVKKGMMDGNEKIRGQATFSSLEDDILNGDMESDMFDDEDEEDEI